MSGEQCGLGPLHALAAGAGAEFLKGFCPILLIVQMVPVCCCLEQGPFFYFRMEKKNVVDFSLLLDQGGMIVLDKNDASRKYSSIGYLTGLVIYLS